MNLDTCIKCNRQAHEAHEGHRWISRKLVLELLEEQLAFSASIAEIAIAKELVAKIEDPAVLLVLQLHIRETRLPVVRSCLKLLVALGGDDGEIDDWIEERRPGWKKQQSRELTALHTLNPNEWAEKIVSTLRANDGNKEATAKALKVARRTFFRWLKDPAVVRIMEGS